MGKNKSDKKQILLEIQNLLEKQRAVLFEEVRNRLGNTSPNTVNGKRLQDKDLVLQFLEYEKKHFLQLEGAFSRLNAGKLGICETCDGEIDYRRLKARPVTRLCMACQTLEDEEDRKSFTQECSSADILSEPFLGRGCRPPSSS